MNIKPICVSYNINRKFGYNATEVISIECEEDFKTRYIDVYLYADNVRNTVDISGSTVTARMVTTPEYDSLLLSDNVACEVAGTGHIIIPIDSAVIAAYPCDFLVEVHIQNGENVLVLPFPLWVSMRASILDNAGVTPESQGTVPELLEEAIAALVAVKNYENLENKPQINGRTLSGDKTSDDLGLQKKLTAGQNITIANDGTISAEDGGVTSYNDLTDKPQFQTRWESSLFDLSGVNVFNDFGSYKELDGKRIWSIMVDKLIPRIPNFSIAFNQLIDVNRIFRTEPPYQGILNPNEIIDLNDGKPNKAIPFQSIYPNLGIDKRGYGLLINLVDPNIYAQLFVWLDYQDTPHIGYRTKTTYTNWSDLIELGSGGSQIVSGVVNANGTITFTDSDGNTFTTTGLSVIGADGVGIADVHIDGGGDLIIETTDGHMENVGHVVGADGQDYVLTPQDKTDIANIVLGELPTTEGVLYGNTSD